MESALTHTPAQTPAHTPEDGAPQTPAIPILEANAVALTIDVGKLPRSGDIIDELDGKPCRFIFTYGELPVSGEVRPREDGVELQLLIEVGHVPYTVESRPERERLLEVIRGFNGKCPEGIDVDQNQSIIVRGTAPLDAPVTATRLISSMVAMLFDVKPVLRSLGDHLPALAQAIPDWGRAAEIAGTSPEA
jgi:hypothetical protein